MLLHRFLSVRRLRVAAVALLTLFPSMSRAQSPVILEKSSEAYPLGRHLAFLEDADGRWTIEEVSSAAFEKRYTESTFEVPNFGFTASAYWFRFDIVNNLATRQKLFLELAYPVMDRIELYVRRDDGGFSRTVAGDTYPYGGKVIRHHHFIFPLAVDPTSSQRVFLRLQTQGSNQAPLTLWTPRAFLEKESAGQLSMGIYYGLMIVMAIYNLFLLITIRDRSYLYYVLFVCSAFVYLSTFDGLAQEYLWPGFPWWANKVYPVSLYTLSLFVLLFTKEFLGLRDTLVVWNRILSALALVALVGAVAALFIPYHLTIVIVAVLATVGCFMIIVAAIISWRKAYRPARYYLAAWSAFLLGGILFSMNKLGLLPRTVLTENAHVIGFALNIVLLSFSLADRINIMRRENERDQARLRRAYERLSEHDQLKSRFFSSISRELRDPLVALVAPLERILGGERGAIPESAKERIRAMARNCQRLLRLINQLLDFSRLEARDMPLAFRPVDPWALTESIVQEFKVFAQNKGLTLDLRGPGDLPVVYVDAGALDKVLCNLLSNACKFTESGGSIIVRLALGDDHLAISVRDSGVGIARSDQQKIFERFYKVQSSTSRHHEGTGIGLAICRELVDLLGGRLDLESEPGVGSTFTIRLPLVDREQIRDESLVCSSAIDDYESQIARSAVEALRAEVGEGQVDQVVGATMTDVGREKVSMDPRRPLLAVVEDNPDMRALLREICQEDYQVLEAADGLDGLEVIQRYRPRLVISDVLMPRLDGLEMVRRLRADPDLASTPVMLLTAKAGPQTRIEGLERGADDYLAKPFEARELLARARNLIRLQEQEDSLTELNARLKQEVVRQASLLANARMLQRYLPPEIVRSILEEGQTVQVKQQRHRITVFRIALRGFGEVVERVEPEEVAAMLNGYLSEMTEIAFGHGATVDKFIRDTVIGFFGAPTSQGAQRDAVRCARMAVEMLERARDVCSRWMGIHGGPVPTPSIAVSSGYAAVGYFGSSSRLEYTAVGGPVEETAAMLPVAGPGEVICGQSAWTLIKDEIDGQACGEVTVGSSSRPVALYRIHVIGQLASAMQETKDLAIGFDMDTVQTETEPSWESGAPMSDTLEPGMVLAGRYEIIRRLGEGSMGSVYRVLDLKLSSEVALKLIRPSLKASPRQLGRFYREVKMARLVSHTNVARIYDLGEWEGHEFISMEYIPGDTLAHRLQTAGPLSLQKGQRILYQLCAGLAAAHTVGIVHCDLKPANIMLGEQDRIVILDFGIARWGSNLQRTDPQSHKVVGTPLYMAPEQFEGSGVTALTDIYSLGVVVFEMFTGRPPFVAESIVRVAYQHTHEPPPDPLQHRPDLPPVVSAVILRCLAKAPQERFNTVGEITTLLLGSMPDLAGTTEL